VCLGRPLALLEIELTLSLLISKFDFEFAEGEDGNNEEYLQSLVSPRKNGLRVTATLRPESST
jgi:cytochrome P450